MKEAKNRSNIGRGKNGERGRGWGSRRDKGLRGAGKGGREKEMKRGLGERN